jgi:hypothetical protein
MKKTIIGVAAAVVALYVFGFLYWGLGPYRTLVWKHADDDGAAGKALREHFPKNGTYYVPGFHHGQAETEASFAKGPVAFVHMLAIDGRPLADVSIMIEGFIVYLLVIALIAVLLRKTLACFPTFGGRVGFVALIGMTATIFFDGGDIAWWQITWSWKLYQAAYAIGFWVLAGVILGWFIRPSTQTS